MTRSRVIVTFIMGLFAALALGSRCEPIHPPEGPGTSYPCGVWGVECPIDGTCCPYKHQCGGHRGYFTTCPAGFCCYEGDDWPRVVSDSGPSDPQRIVKAIPIHPDASR